MSLPSGDKPRRLFYALWPDDELRLRLAKTLYGIVPEGIGKPVLVENLHITLVFLGAVEASKMPCVEEAVHQVKALPFRLTLDRVGHWGKPRILWGGISQVPEQLHALVDGLRRGVANCDIALDPRPYQPHLTFVRKVSKRPGRLQIAPLDWEVDRYALVESLSTPEGVSYRPLRFWPLG